MGGIRVIKIRGEKRFDSNIALVSYVGGDLEVLLGQFNQSGRSIANEEFGLEWNNKLGREPQTNEREMDMIAMNLEIEIK